jgi:ribosome-binding protein aMBF1 (putative translation factor)
MINTNPLQVVSQFIAKELRKGISKEDIAKKMNTSVGIVTRLERCNLDASVELVQRLADATGTRLSIRFLPL